MMNRRIRLLVACTIGAIAFQATSAVGQTVDSGVPNAVEKQLGALGAASVVAGVRIWANTWDIFAVERVPVVPNPTNPSSIVLQDVVRTSVSATEFVPIPFIAARVDNWLASVYYFPRTEYDSRNNQIGTVERDEFDVTFGYSFVNRTEGSLIASVAYKQAFVSKLVPQLEDSSARIKGVLIGISGSASITEKLRLYGSAAYGFAKQTVAFTGLDGGNRYDGSYRVAEVGLTYVAYVGGVGQALKSVAINGGYRIQNFTTKSVPLFTTTASVSPVVLSTEYRDLTTSTDGFVLGVVAAF